MPLNQPPNIMTPPTLDPASPVPINVLASPGRSSTDATPRLQETLEPDRPLRHQTSSLRLATAAARGMVKGLFSIGGGKKSTAPTHCSQNSLHKSPSVTSLLSTAISTAESEEDEEYIYPGGVIPAAALGPQLPPLQGRRWKTKVGVKREEPVFTYTDFPEFDTVIAAAAAKATVHRVERERPVSSGSSIETILNIGPLERKGSWKGKYNYRRLRQSKSDENSVEGSQNKGSTVEGEEEESPPPTPRTIIQASPMVFQTSPVTAKAASMTIQAASMMFPTSNTSKPLHSSPKERRMSTPIPSPETSRQLPTTRFRQHQSHSSSASAPERAPPPSVCSAPSSIQTFTYHYSSADPGRITSLSNPVTYRLPDTDGYVSFPPYVPSGVQVASRIGRLLSGSRNGSTSSLVEDVEDQDGSFRKAIAYLTPLRRRTGSISTFTSSFDGASIVESAGKASVKGSE